LNVKAAIDFPLPEDDSKNIKDKDADKVMNAFEKEFKDAFPPHMENKIIKKRITINTKKK